MSKNCIVAQSGGPTAAINASLAGVVAAARDFGIYDKIISIVGIGANLPIISFGNTITNSVYYGYISDGCLGIFNNLLAGVSLGISATIIFSFILIIFFKPKD